MLTPQADLTPEAIIKTLGLIPHPEEGGWFRETWRAEETLPAQALPDRYGSPRAAGTAIYYLLTPETFSAMHRLASHEIFHFYLGDPVEMLLLYPDNSGTDGSGRTLLLGPDLASGMRPQVIVPRGVWQGSRLAPGGRVALLGCTVSPGFEYEDYEHGMRADLLAGWPDWAQAIRARTHEQSGEEA